MLRRYAVLLLPGYLYLILHFHRAESVVQLMKHFFALISAAASVNETVDDVLCRGEAMTPADVESLVHLLGSWSSIHVHEEWVFGNFTFIQPGRQEEPDGSICLVSCNCKAGVY